MPPPQWQLLNPTFSTRWIEIRPAPDIPLWSACHVMDTPLVKRTGNVNVCHIAKGWVNEWKSRTALSLCVNAAVQSVIWLQPERRGGGGGVELGLPRKAHFHFNLVSAWRTSASLTPILIPWLLLLQDHRDRSSARKRTSPVIFYLLLLSLIPLLKHPCQSENMQKAQMWKMLTVEGTFWLSGLWRSGYFHPAQWFRWRSGCFYSCATIYMQHS